MTCRDEFPGKGSKAYQRLISKPPSEDSTLAAEIAFAPSGPSRVVSEACAPFFFMTVYLYVPQDTFTHSSLKYFFFK